MTVSTRILMSLVFLAAGLVGVGSMQQNGSSSIGVQRLRSANDANSRRVAARFTVVAQRIKVKTHLVERLIAGELGLFEAAAWFERLNRTPPEHMDVHWRDLPGGCDGEKLCRQVISWSASQLRTTATPSQAEARIQELEEELQLHIACNGKVDLPEL